MQVFEEELAEKDLECFRREAENGTSRWVRRMPEGVASPRRSVGSIRGQRIGEASNPGLPRRQSQFETQLDNDSDAPLITAGRFRPLLSEDETLSVIVRPQRSIEIGVVEDVSGHPSRHTFRRDTVGATSPENLGQQEGVPVFDPLESDDDADSLVPFRRRDTVVDALEFDLTHDDSPVLVVGSSAAEV